MPREPKAGSFVIASMQVDPPSRIGGWRAYDDATAVPQAFGVAFQLDQPRFFVRLTIETASDRPVVKHIEVTPGWLENDGSVTGGEEGVTSTNLRQLLIDRLVRTALDAVRRPIEWAGDDNLLNLIRSGFEPGAAEALNRSTYTVPGVTPPGIKRIDGDRHPLTQRGRQTPNDRIAKAADLYQAVVKAGSRAPVKDVGLALGYSTSQASRYLKTARERGLLDEVPEVES